jgi:hypothetical protein
LPSERTLSRAAAAPFPSRRPSLRAPCSLLHPQRVAQHQKLRPILGAVRGFLGSDDIVEPRHGCFLVADAYAQGARSETLKPEAAGELVEQEVDGDRRPM